MKRVKGLYNDLIDLNSIILDIINASRGKRKRKDVIKYIGNYDSIDPTPQILKTANKIRNLYINGFDLGVTRKKTINDGISKKKRNIIIPKFFPDHIISHGLVRVMSISLDNSMYKYTCASIKNRGIRYAKETVEGWIRNDIKFTKYFAKLDISKFYDSVTIDVIMRRLESKIKDSKFLYVIYSFVKQTNGLPIGSYLSQWLANFILNPLDNFIKQRIYSNIKRTPLNGVKYYIRYMDDLVLFDNNKKRLHHCVKQIKIYLENYLQLKLKDNWQVVCLRTENKDKFLDFVGFRFYINRTTIRYRIYNSLIRTCNKLHRNNFKIHNCRQFISYNGWIENSDGNKLSFKLNKNCILKLVNLRLAKI